MTRTTYTLIFVLRGIDLRKAAIEDWNTWWPSSTADEWEQLYVK